MTQIKMKPLHTYNKQEITLLGKQVNVDTTKEVQDQSSFQSDLFGDRQKDVMQNVRGRLKGDDKLTRAIKRYIDKVYDNTTAGLSLIQSSILGESLLTVLPEQTDEEKPDSLHTTKITPFDSSVEGEQ